MFKLAYLTGFANIIRAVSPVSGTKGFPIDGKVLIYFTFDMVPDTINTSTILLLDEGSNKVSCQVSYDKKVATIVSQSSLDFGARYQVLIKGGSGGVKTITGKILGSDYVSNFEASTDSPLETVVMVFPPDKSVVRAPAIFSWGSVPGADAYEFQISKESKFGSVSFSSNVVGEGITPDFVFEHDTIYYWRVMAFGGQGAGRWSEPWQFRFSVFSEEEEARQGVIDGPVTTFFDIVSVTPSPDSLFADENSLITVKFNNGVIDYTTDISVCVENMTGVGEPTQVSGEIAGQGDTIQFIPDSPLLQNAIYTIVVGKSTSSIEGVSLDDDVSWSFSTVFSPYYSNINNVRARIGMFLGDISDLEIAREILAVSLWANQIAAKPYGSINDDYLGETQSKTTNEIFYRNYTEFETCVRLLNRKITDHIQFHGQRRKIGDLEIKSSGSMVPDLNIALKRLELLRNRSEMYLTMGKHTYSLPKPAIKGDRNYPYPFNKRNSF